MHITGTFRIGKDAELRYLPDGSAVTNLSLAANYGKRDESTGKKPTQWVEASLWGKRAEALAEYLIQGQQVTVILEEPHIETYEGRNGTGSKLTGRIISLELVGSPPEQRQQHQAPTPPARTQAPRQAPARTAPATTGSGFDDMADDIPF